MATVSQMNLWTENRGFCDQSAYTDTQSLNTLTHSLTHSHTHTHTHTHTPRHTLHSLHTQTDHHAHTATQTQAHPHTPTHTHTACLQTRETVHTLELLFCSLLNKR